MKNVLKKILCISTAAAIALPSSCLGVFAADTAAGAKAEKSFFEDFEKYQTVVHYDSSDNVDNAKPADGDYSNTTVYPNGTASVYEGNAMNNVAVKDAAGNAIDGGLDGWYGFYNGAASGYNKTNRRLTVGAYAGKFDIDGSGEENYKGRINASQTLKFEPHMNTDATASLNRNNVDISNYSFLSSRVSLSGKDNFGKAGIALTVNPENIANDDGTDMKFDSIYDLVTFESAAETKKIDIKFNGETINTIDVGYFMGGTEDQKAQWYTVEIRLMNNPNGTNAKVDIYDDNNDTKLCGKTWTKLEGFNYNSANKYGIRFYAQSVKDVSQPRMLLDDVKFTKDSFGEDFESYNIKEYLPEISSGFFKISNGAKGNLNDTTAYANGVYEGNVAKNNYVYNSLKENVYGDVPFWQGYISSVDGKDAYNKDGSQRTCSIYKQPYGTLANKQVLHLYPKVGTANGEKTIYAGMSNADFDGNTVWKTKLILFGNTAVSNESNVDSTFKLQLTSGKEKTKAEIAKKYDGNLTEPTTTYTDSLKTYDVLTFANGKIYKGSDTSAANIGTYSFGSSNVYDITYVVDRQGKTPKEKILIAKNGTTFYETNFEDMTFADGGFAFDKNVTGFRYVATAKETLGKTTTAGFEVSIDNVEINKYFSANVADSGISAVKVSDAGAVDAIVNLPSDGDCQIIAVVYDADGNMVSIGYKGAMERNAGYNPASITINDFPTDYASGDYTLKLFCWDGLKAALKPIMAEYTLR